MQKKGRTVIKEPEGRDYLDYFDEQNYSKVIEMVEEHSKNLLYEWIDGFYEKLEKDLQDEIVLLDYFRDSLRTEARDQSLFVLGGLYRATKIFGALLFENSMDRRVQMQLKKEFDEIKHLKDVIQALEIHGSMTHTELCNCLGLNPSTLSEAMKKILSTGTVSALSAGKYRLYSLTDSGIRLGRQFRNEMELLTPEEQLNRLRRVLENIVDVDRKNEIVNQLKELLSKVGETGIFRGDRIRYYSMDTVSDMQVTRMFEAKNKKHIYCELDTALESVDEESCYIPHEEAFNTSAFLKYA